MFGAAMRRITSLYIGGPDVAFPGSVEILNHKRSLTEDAGFVPVIPSDSILVETTPSEAMAREIYMDRVSRMRLADAAIINLTPWRGPTCESSAAYEIGFLAALGKPVFAYLNVTSEAEAELRVRVEDQIGAKNARGKLVDAYGVEIEDFGLPESLMVWAEARRLYAVVTPDLFGDTTGFEMCLDAVRLYAGDD
jgi:nucleoside 2-deoxyribosyltransferase